MRKAFLLLTFVFALCFSAGALVGVEWCFSRFCLSIDSRHLGVYSTGNGISEGLGITPGFSYDPYGALSIGLKWTL